ncbi:MAG: ABC transporter permease subunit [Nostocaceae cyanobacterium]|nr:ABC transporter permease subunit [Nostocaceae cyanobacterium]
MKLNFLDRIGDWNPQLLREIKGRFKILPVIIAFAASLIGQLIIFLSQFRDFPGEKYSMSGSYCLAGEAYQKQLKSLNSVYYQLKNQLAEAQILKNIDNVDKIKTQLAQIRTEQNQVRNILYQQSCPPDQIDMQMWWQDHWEYIFLTLSVIFIFTLLVAGTYLLINDLAKEERRGTLNFLRLSPQSEIKIFTGKILGVPILIYLAVAAAIPLHILAGSSAQISLSHIFSFYTILAASCIFFFTAALLFGLFGRLFSGFQPWLGSGAVLVFLMITMSIANSSSHFNHAAAWLRMLSPFDMTNYLFPNLFNGRYSGEELEKLQFFYLPLGKNLIGLLALHLANYGLFNYWIWQGLKRRFRNPNASLLTKGNSYLLVASFQAIFWGFTLQSQKNNYCPPKSLISNNLNNCLYDLNTQISNNFGWIILFNVFLLFSLLAILSPHRQAIQDWARYRHYNFSPRQTFWHNAVLSDLIWGDKSPALLTMAINLLIFATPLLIWIVISLDLNVNNSRSINWLINDFGRLKAILGLFMFVCLMMIYTTVVQRVLLMKNSKRGLWATGTLTAAIFLPPIILGLMKISPAKNPIPWLFSTFPWASLEHASTTSVFMALLGELTVLLLLNWELARQIKLAGESTTKKLLTTS